MVGAIALNSLGAVVWDDRERDCTVYTIQNNPIPIASWVEGKLRKL